MKVAVVGWYGHHNAGDERILYCLEKFFANDELMPINGYAGMKQNWDELNRCDYVLFGGGGLIMRGTGKHASLFARLKPPLGCIGISVEAVHEDTVDLLNVLKDKSEFILVRDQGSRKAFASHSKVVVGPDLTFLNPYDVVEEVSEDVCGINLRPWKYWQGEHNGKYDVFMRRLNRRFPNLKYIYPLPKWEKKKAISILQKKFSKLSPVCLYNEPGRISDADELRDFFQNVKENFAPQQISKCRFIVSMRLHALIFACQMGIPFISLSYLPKNREFCKSVGLVKNSINLFEMSQLEQAISHVKIGYDQIREHLIEVRFQNCTRINVLMKELTWKQLPRSLPV